MFDFFMPWIVVTTKLLLLISIVGYQEKLWEFMEWSPMQRYEISCECNTFRKDTHETLKKNTGKTKIQPI